MTIQDILEALGTVQEPDLGKDLVSLQMVRDIRIEGRSIVFTLVLTTPACPLKELMRRDCERAIRERCGALVQLLSRKRENGVESPIVYPVTLHSKRSWVAGFSEASFPSQGAASAGLATRAPLLDFDREEGWLSRP